MALQQVDDAWWASMTSTDTPQAGRCWWGWGFVNELKQDPMLSAGFPIRPQSVAEASKQLRPSRLSIADIPESFRSVCTDHPFERLLHSRGRDFVDLVEGVSKGAPENPFDLVAFPTNEDQIAGLLQYCSEKKIAVVPFGGGSSVAFGVNPPADSEGYTGSISVDMLRFDKLLEVNEETMIARVQAGVYGPALESLLKKKGFTFRYFPQSFQFSTVGGWAVTRGAGHFATGPTHIEDLVETIRLVTPAGVTESRALPGSGAGPSENRLYCGSEGIFGICTEVRLKIRKVPTLRESATVIYRGESEDDAFFKGARAIQKVIQTGLQPANLRMVYGTEVQRTTQLDGLDNAAVLLVGFEAANTAQDIKHQMESTLAICQEMGGEVQRGSSSGKSGKGEREGIAGKWGTGFMKGGYTFSAATLAGACVNTFETAVTWDKFFSNFHTAVLEATRNAVKEHCGHGTVTCRFTHIYPDGPAPYYTVVASGKTSPVDMRAEQWLKIKAAAMEAVMKNGGTSTHHHAVGKLHRPHYHMELGAMARPTLEAIKRVHDPAWILNPGVLIERPASKL